VTARRLLRHAVATVAYRGAKVVRDAPDGFAGYRAAEGTRTPAQILAHIGDLFDWALWLAQGEHIWQDSEPQPWELEVERFFATVRAFDDYLASDERLLNPAERLLQGPVADALAHVGQLALLRRLAGAPVKGENYFKSTIEAGSVGREQAAPGVEFD
jgi:hypothetical protein